MTNDNKIALLRARRRHPVGKIGRDGCMNVLPAAGEIRRYVEHGTTYALTMLWNNKVDALASLELYEISFDDAEDYAIGCDKHDTTTDYWWSNARPAKSRKAKLARSAAFAARRSAALAHMITSLRSTRAARDRAENAVPTIDDGKYGPEDAAYEEAARLHRVNVKSQLAIMQTTFTSNA